MKPFSIGVAIAAAIALVAGVTKGSIDVLGLAADPTLLSIGAVGLMLALTTFRSPLISPSARLVGARGIGPAVDRLKAGCSAIELCPHRARPGIRTRKPGF